jgi:hypothetical protein
MKRSFYMHLPNSAATSILKIRQVLPLIFCLLLLSSCIKDVDEEEPAKVTTFATGFNNPRGLKFGPDGNLYVAEAGLGGTEETSKACPDWKGEAALGSPTGGRISKVSSSGMRTTVTDKLPTSGSDFFINGVSDVAFYGNTLYALISGGGCSHSVPDVPNGIVKINSSEDFTIVADLGGWQQTHPVAHPPQDFEAEGTWYSMVNVGNAFYALDPNHGELVKVTTDGEINRVVDFTIDYGHIVPTAIDYRGNFYIGTLGVFPIVDGSQNIYKVTPSGEVKIAGLGLTAVVGLAFDKKEHMYVLETTTGNDFPTPGSGRIVRVNPNGAKQVIADGFSNPTALTYGPDGNLYVSNWGFSGSEGQGEILKVTLNKKAIDYCHL